jgi:acylphosphatase
VVVSAAEKDQEARLAAYRYVVRGRVQGVGYRYFVMRQADTLGVTGFARNRTDGTVEVVAEGSEAALSDLEARLKEGPAFSEVDDVAREPIEPRGDAGFHVR